MEVLYPKNFCIRDVSELNDLTLDDFIYQIIPVHFLYVEENSNWVIIEETSYGGIFSLNLKFYKIVDI